jgi:hypothetical protein
MGEETHGAELVRPADEKFKKTVPEVDRETAGGLIREVEREWARELLGPKR